MGFFLGCIRLFSPYHDIKQRARNITQLSGILDAHQSHQKHFRLPIYKTACISEDICMCIKFQINLIY